jgi:hypothetical protein
MPRRKRAAALSTGVAGTARAPLAKDAAHVIIERPTHPLPVARLSAATCARCYRTLLSAAAEAAACAAAAAWTTGVLQAAEHSAGCDYTG